MTKRQKRILTKHYVLGTRNGKKAFKFRQQFAPFGCYVQCEESQQSYPVPQQSYPLQQQIPPGLSYLCKYIFFSTTIYYYEVFIIS